MSFIDRLLTIVVTATLTSAAWIVVGSGYVDGFVSAGTGRQAAARPVLPRSNGTSVSAESSPSAAGQLLIPVEGVVAEQLTDTFNDRRGGGERRHEALDIMAPRGTPVLAAAAGSVEKLFKSDAGGNTVYVRSADRRMIYYYAHLDRYEPGLAEGRSVARGQRLGTVGSTGNANPDAPHLHFAMIRTSPETKWWEPGTAIDPYVLLGGKV
jgi:murein DD-endopeptidase MepM/ murein hydrolase activator NlpD